MVVVLVVVTVVLVNGNKLFNKSIVGLSFSVDLSTVTIESGTDKVVGVSIVDAIAGIPAAEVVSVALVLSTVDKDSIFDEVTSDSRCTPVVGITVVANVIAGVVCLIIGFVIRVVRVFFDVTIVVVTVFVRVVFLSVVFVVARSVVTGEPAVVVNNKASNSSSNVFGVVNCASFNGILRDKSFNMSHIICSFLKLV